MSNILYRYFIVVVACISLLFGLQIPNFIDQYQKRIDAHLREANANLQPFLEIADKYFSGDINKLIELHQTSNNSAFQEEGVAIEKIIARKLRFESEIYALNSSLPVKALHMLFHGDRDILDEVMGQYSYAIPLNQDSLVFGASFTLGILLLVDLLSLIIRLAVIKLTQSGFPTQGL